MPPTYSEAGAPGPLASAPDHESVPFLSVVMRTQGARLASLREALLCLAAQSDDDFEVVLVVHHADEKVVGVVQDVVADFGPELLSRVRVVQALSTGRAHPLNVGIDHANGTHLAFLDDDDHVTADWVEVFRRGATESQGRVVRSLAVVQAVRSTDRDDDGAYIPCGPFESRYAKTFDDTQSRLANQTPIHSFAVPRKTIELSSLRFDESLPEYEHSDFLMRVAALIGVYDTCMVTAVDHEWVEVDSAAAHNAQVGKLRAEVDDLRTRLAAIENSEMWRLTKPIRVTVNAIRSTSGRLKRMARERRIRRQR